MKANAISCFVSVLAAVAATTASAGVFDDAKFKLDLRGGESTFTKPGDIGNAYDFSSASPVVGYMGDFAGQKTYTTAHGTLPGQVVADVVNPYVPTSVKSRNVLHFYQDTMSETSSARTGVLLEGAMCSTPTQTFYIRFRWDGRAPGSTATPCYIFENGKNADGWREYGTALSIDGVNAAGTSGCLGFRGAKSSDKLASLSVNAGEWNDAFVTFAQNEDNTGYTATLSLCKVPAKSGETYADPAILAGSVSKAVPLQFYSGNIVLGTYHNSAGSATTSRTFRGDIAEFMIWERALTEREMIEVMSAGASAPGGEWQVGAANGSANEFSDTDPAAVYDVQSMPWRMMRKTLDASHPSLSLSAAMTAGERQMARTLAFTPILSGTGASVPVEVSLNGTVVGEIDLASETSITLPKKLWLHDGGANVITVTRKAPVSGTVQFDAISLAPAAVQPAGSVLEDATFKLDLRGGESTFTQPGDLGNVFDFSSASPLVGYMGDQRGPWTYDATYGSLTAQEASQVRNPYYPLVVKEQTVLHFYQDNPDATDETKGVRSGVVFPGLAPQSDVQTFYLRFRWDGAVQGTTPYPVYLLQSGNADNGNSDYGVAVFMETPTVSEDGTTTNVLVKCRVGQENGTKNFLNSGLSVSSGTWNDLFVTFAKNDGEDKYTTTWSLCQTPAASGSGFEKAVLSKKSVVSASHPQFNSSNLTIGTYHNSGSVADSTRCFRGLVADFMIWERALTDDEKRQVMNGSAGAKWFVGLPNGSADEFGDASPAATYEPETMPWRQMRKTLDASNPTLSLRCTVAGNDVNAAKLLSVSPILRDGAEVSCPVAVSVNGTSIGTYDFADPKKRCILVERALWAPDASGKATVTLARTGTISGTLAIDHLSLSGTWMIGNDDGRTSPMPNQTAIESSRGFVGDTEESRFCSAVSVGANRASIFLDAWLPDGAEAYDWRFATDIHSNYQTADLGFSLFVNGTQVGAEWPLPAGNNANEKNVWNIPAGTLVSGVNHLQLKMTTPASGTGWAFLDYYRLQLVEPPKAFVLVIR